MFFMVLCSTIDSPVLLITLIITSRYRFICDRVHIFFFPLLLLLFFFFLNYILWSLCSDLNPYWIKGMCICLLPSVFPGFVCRSVYFVRWPTVYLFSSPQWGAADAEIKVPSGENTGLKRSPSIAWSRSVYSHTCYAYCQGFLPCLFLPLNPFTCNFSKTSPDFFLCWLWLTLVPV